MSGVLPSRAVAAAGAAAAQQQQHRAAAAPAKKNESILRRRQLMLTTSRTIIASPRRLLPFFDQTKPVTVTSALLYGDDDDGLTPDDVLGAQLDGDEKEKRRKHRDAPTAEGPPPPPTTFRKKNSTSSFFLFHSSFTQNPQTQIPPDSTGAPSMGRRGRAGRPVFDDDDEEGILASEYGDDDDLDDDVGGLRSRASSSSASVPKKKKTTKSVSKKSATKRAGFDDDSEDDDDDDDGIDDDEEILDEASALAAATLAGDVSSSPSSSSAAALDDDEDEEDDLEGLLDAAAATTTAAALPSSSPAVAAGSTNRKRRASSSSAASASNSNDDPLSGVVGLPDEFDGGELQEGADALGDEEGLAEEEEEEELPAIEYREPPRRERVLGDLLVAAGVEVSSFLTPSSSPSIEELVVMGVEDEVALVAPGDLFSTQATGAKTSPAALARELAAAAAAGAVAALVPESFEKSLAALFGDSSSSCPLPVVFVSAESPVFEASLASSSSSSSSTSTSSTNNTTTSLARAAGAAARSFYDDPTARLSTVLFVGGPGKTTSAWLTRGILEEAGALVGMFGSIEYALHADRLDASGGLWAADEEDPTEARECSSAFHLAPYKGKYPLPAPFSTALRVQKVTAGMADRGATAAILELSAQALVDGAAEGVDVDVAVFTGSPMKAVAATEARKKEAAASAASDDEDRDDEDDDYPSSSSSSSSASASSSSSSPALSAAAAAEALVVAEGEAELLALEAVFESLTDSDRQRAVINLDDLNADRITKAALRGGAPAITFGFYNTSADVKCSRVEFGLWETELLLGTPIGALSLSTQLVCRHNAFNVLASVAAGLAVTVLSAGAAASAAAAVAPEPEEAEEGEFGTKATSGAAGRALDLRTIVRGIEATEVIPGRTEAIDEGQPFAVIVDSARTPDALGRLLDGVREAGAKRLILVIGCEGGKPKAARPYIGEVAHFKADVVIVTSDNPRGEDPRSIVSDVVSGFPDEILKQNARVPYGAGFLQDPGRVSPAAVEFLWQACYEHSRYVCEDRWMAIRWAVGTAAADDAVLIVGKGCEDFQEWVRPGEREGTGTVRGWFDDRVEARHALVKAAELWGVSALDRSELPWMEWDEREPRFAS